MPIFHLLLILLVVLIWGMNFIFVKIGLDEMSPLLLCALRFFLASIPAVFFIKPPKAPFKIVASYGLVMFGLQFSLIFMGMYVGMTPGMASLIMQVQVFFSMFFAVFFLGEQPSLGQIVGALVSFSGIALVAMHFDASVSLLGFVLTLGAAAAWGVGNLITKKVKVDNLMSLVVWGSFVACLPMFLLSLALEGFQNFVTSYERLSWMGIGAILYIVYVSTWVGYGVWNWLISRYPIGMIVPFSLLIPVVGILGSGFFLGEAFQAWKLVAGSLVIGGLCINLFSPRFFVRKVQAKEA